MDAYLRWASTTGASFVPAWDNASVVVATLVVFLLCFTVSAFARREWLLDVGFLALVTGGILVPWSGMVVLSMGAVIIAIVVSYAHRALRPEESARITAEADRIATPAVDAFAHELLGERPGRTGAPSPREKE